MRTEGTRTLHVPEVVGPTYCEVECDFAILLGDLCKEAGFLVCGQFVGKGGGGDEGCEQWQ